MIYAPQIPAPVPKLRLTRVRMRGFSQPETFRNRGVKESELGACGEELIEEIWARMYEEHVAPLIEFIFFVQQKQGYPTGLNTFVSVTTITVIGLLAH